MLKKYLIFLLLFLSTIISLFSFGTNSSSLKFPVHQKSYSISSYYEYRYLDSYHFHNGIDIPSIVGTPIYGNCVIITYHNGYKSLYGHISSNFLVNVGDYVTTNDIVAYVGPKYLENGKLNGNTTGPHLHFTLYKNGKLINPLSIKYST